MNIGVREHILDEFTVGYLRAALWTGTDETDESGGDPLEDNYDLEDFADDTLERVVADCQEFQDITQALGCEEDDDVMGHDFWLTRNGHGAGFWDGDYPEPAASELTRVSKNFGERCIYVGDDGQLHIS